MSASTDNMDVSDLVFHRCTVVKKELSALRDVGDHDGPV